MKRLLFINTASNYAVFILQVAVALVMTPLYVKYMGLRDYGLWEVIVSVIGYSGMLDLGLWPTISRFVAKYQAEKNRIKQEETFATAFVFLTIVGFVGAGLVTVAVVLLEYELFFGSSSDTAYYRLFLFVLFVNVTIKFPGIVAEAYLEGQQRYLVKNLFSIASLVVSSSIVYALIAEARGLLLLATVGVCAMAVKYSYFYLLLFRSQPQEFSFRLSAVSLRHLRRLLKFGMKSFVQGVSSRVIHQAGPVIIAAFSTTAMVPFFTIPASLVRYASNFMMTSTHAFMPLFSALFAADKEKEIRQIFLAANRIIVAFGVLMLLGVALVGPEFISIWISPEMASQSREVLILLVLGALGLGLNPFGSRYLTAIDKHGVYAKYDLVFAALSLTLSIALMYWIGLLGVALGVALPVLISLPLYLSVACQHLNISLSRYFANLAFPIVPASIVAFIAWYESYHELGIPNNFFDLGLVGLIMVVAFGVVFSVFDLIGNSNASVIRFLIGQKRLHGGGK